MDSDTVFSRLMTATVGILIIFLFCGVAFSDSYAEIKQKGDYNIAVIEQVGQGTALVEQDGNINEIRISQDGWNKGEALIFGSGNANCFQSFVPFFGRDVLTNYFQWQVGQDNSQKAIVEGENNLISQFQEGTANYQDLRVIGDSNWIKQIQQGDNNTSAAEINGNFNALLHLQKGNNFFLPTISIVGDFKQVSVIQE